MKTIDNNASGIFCVDIKTDKNDKVKITEINAGRFFTTSYFFSKAGSNMPYAYIKFGLGEKEKISKVKFNSVPKDYYWVRNVDMGYKLIKDKWKFKKK